MFIELLAYVSTSIAYVAIGFFLVAFRVLDWIIDALILNSGRARIGYDARTWDLGLTLPLFILFWPLVISIALMVGIAKLLRRMSRALSKFFHFFVLEYAAALWNVLADRFGHRAHSDGVVQPRRFMRESIVLPHPILRRFGVTTRHLLSLQHGIRVLWVLMLVLGLGDLVSVATTTQPNPMVIVLGAVLLMMSAYLCWLDFILLDHKRRQLQDTAKAATPVENVTILRGMADEASTVITSHAPREEVEYYCPLCGEKSSRSGSCSKDGLTLMRGRKSSTPS